MSGFLLFRRIVEGLDSAHLAAGGTESIYGAATTIIIQVLSITFFSCMAFGVATATLVSQEMGAGRPERAERIAWSSVKLGAMAFGAVGVLEIMFPGQVIRVFNQSPGVIAAATPSLQLMGACGPVIATGMILTQALFGAGNTRYVMVVELLLHLGWLVPGAYLLGVVLELGLIGVWSSAAVYVGLLTAAMVYKFRQGTWKSIKI
jgi:Na+-driven multidrug efflux pump